MADPAGDRPLAAPSLFGTLRCTANFVSHCLATVVDSLFGRVTDQAIDRRMRDVGETTCRIMRMRLEVSGVEALDPGRVYLFMSNHESFMDIPLIFRSAPRPPRMVGKSSLFRIPVLGAAFRAAGIVPIDRQDRAKAITSLRYASRLMAERGLSVWMAPEGTRTPDGTLQPFKKGGFMLALELGVPIVPIGIVGAREVMPPKALLARKDQQVAIRYGKPIDPAAYGLERRDELMEAVRSAIAELREPKRLRLQGNERPFAADDAHVAL